MTIDENAQTLKADKNGDGHIAESELSTAIDENAKLKRLEDEDNTRDAQRHMAWFALFGMLLYPIFIFAAAYCVLPAAVTALQGIAPTYFVSVAAIVAAFYGKEAWESGKKDK